MPDHIYKLLELTGSSTVSIEDAVNHAIKRGARTVRKLRWFEVQEVRGQIDNDAVAHWQVSVTACWTCYGITLQSLSWLQSY